MNAALESKRGVRVSFKTKGEAVTFAHRAHNFRVLQRRENEKIYPIGAPLHGRSNLDTLKVTVRETDVFITPMTADDIEVVEL